MIVAILSLLLGALLLPITAYLLLLTAVSLLPRRRPAAAATPDRLPRFAIVVPAHDEETVVAATVASLRAVHYPADAFTVMVVADNCSDATAQCARDAGATVIERCDDDRRGKGHALDFGFRAVLADGTFDAVAVVDADTAVSPQLLRAFAERLAGGARAVQARYGVRNVDASWRTRLMAVALGMFHDLRSLARERLGLSCGLRGNGMCFTAELLREHPHRATGLVEDVEYGAALAMSGIRVAYVHDAAVRGDMAVAGGAARHQRQRWESGRGQLTRVLVPGLLAAAWRRRSKVALDVAVDLLVPPLSRVALAVAAGTALETAARLVGGQFTAAAPLWAFHLVALAAYVVRGTVLSGQGWRGFAALATAPAYVAWKLLRVSRRPATAWVRTERG